MLSPDQRDAREETEQVFGSEHGRCVATLIRFLGDFDFDIDIAEEAVGVGA